MIFRDYTKIWIGFSLEGNVYGWTFFIFIILFVVDVYNSHHSDDDNNENNNSKIWIIVTVI